MAITVSFNGGTFSIPLPGETGWGTTLTAYLSAIAAGTLQRSGGLQPLSADLDLGPSFGITAVSGAFGALTGASLVLSGDAQVQGSLAVEGTADLNSLITNQVTLRPLTDVPAGSAPVVFTLADGNLYYLASTEGTPFQLNAGPDTDPTFNTLTVTGAATVGSLNALNGIHVPNTATQSSIGDLLLTRNLTVGSSSINATITLFSSALRLNGNMLASGTVQAGNLGLTPLATAPGASTAAQLYALTDGSLYYVPVGGSPFQLNAAPTTTPTFSTLTVTGSTALEGPVAIGGDLVVSGEVTAASNLTVNGLLSVPTTDGMNVQGPAVLGSDLSVAGNATVTGELDVDGPLAVLGAAGMNVQGPTALVGDLTGANATFSGTATADTLVATTAFGALGEAEFANGALLSPIPTPTSGVSADGRVYANSADSGNLHYYRADGTDFQLTGGAAGGTVTSVALAAPSIFTVSGSPVTGAGTLTLALASQAVSRVFAAPSTGSGTPTFRVLDAVDIPIIPSTKVSGLAPSATTDTTNATNITSGVLDAARLSGVYGGITGVGTLTSGSVPASLVTGLAPSATTDTTNAANITSGVLPAARLSGAYTGITAVGTLTAGSVPATLLTGTVASAQIAGSYTGITAVGTLTAGSIPVSLVTGLAPSATTDTTNAANITSGTLASARISGSYTGITAVGTLTAGAVPTTLLTGVIASAQIAGAYTGITQVGTLAQTLVATGFATAANTGTLAFNARAVVSSPGDGQLLVAFNNGTTINNAGIGFGVMNSPQSPMLQAQTSPPGFIVNTTDNSTLVGLGALNYIATQLGAPAGTSLKQGGPSFALGNGTPTPTYGYGFADATHATIYTAGVAAASWDSTGALVNRAGISATTVAASSNATVGGTLGVTGASTLAAVSATTLSTSGLATLASASVTGTLGAGASTLASLAVTGAATVGTTLVVTGALTAKGAQNFFPGASGVTTVVSDVALPIQLAANATLNAAGAEAYIGFNKGTTYGFLLGYSNINTGTWPTGGLMRMVTGDAFSFVMNNTTLAMSIASSGAVSMPVTLAVTGAFSSGAATLASANVTGAATVGGQLTATMAQNKAYVPTGVSTSTTLTATNFGQLIRVTATGVVLTLPTPTAIGQRIIILNASSGTVTFNAPTGGVIAVPGTSNANSRSVAVSNAVVKLISTDAVSSYALESTTSAVT